MSKKFLPEKKCIFIIINAEQKANNYSENIYLNIVHI